MPSVVFLRAVNVGGTNLCRPAVLAKQLGKFDVVNIGAVGTFVVRKTVNESALRKEIAVQLAKAFGVKCEIMISHLNGNFRAIAARRADSLTFSRTTNVPTAPMLMMSNLASCFAISAGWHRFVPPTFTARRNTTDGMRAKVSQLLVNC